MTAKTKLWTSSWPTQIIPTSKGCRCIICCCNVMTSGLYREADYRAMIVSPEEQGAGPGSDRITKNFEVLGSYTNAFTRNTAAFRGMRDMGAGSSGLVGTSGFIQTDSTCSDASSGASVPRYDYFSSASSGGLIGGLTKDQTALQNAVFNIMSGITGPAEPTCSQVQLVSVGADGIKTSAAHHVPNARLCQLDASVFVNPADKARICQEGFGGTMPDDNLAKAYLWGLGLLGFYLVVQVMTKSRK